MTRQEYITSIHSCYLYNSLHTPAKSTVFVSRYEESLADFQQTLKELRGNQLIDYGALGLRYKLNACEVSTAVLITSPWQWVHHVNCLLKTKTDIIYVFGKN